LDTQFLVYVDVTVLGLKIIVGTKKLTQKLSDIGKENGLKVNAQRTTYTFMTHHQNTGQNIIQ
jgi:hypothetical protein